MTKAPIRGHFIFSGRGISDICAHHVIMSVNNELDPYIDARYKEDHKRRAFGTQVHVIYCLLFEYKYEI
jgi:hypothetical protein